MRSDPCHSDLTGEDERFEDRDDLILPPYNEEAIQLVLPDTTLQVMDSVRHHLLSGSSPRNLVFALGLDSGFQNPKVGNNPDIACQCPVNRAALGDLKQSVSLIRIKVSLEVDVDLDKIDG